MKKLTNSLKMAMISLLLLLVISSNISCSKDIPPDPKPQPPPIDTIPVVKEGLPHGTANATRSILPYNSIDTINIHFDGATQGVWINNVFKGLSPSGNWTYVTDSLKVTTNFTIMAKSKDSTAILNLSITVNPYFGVTLLTTGSYRFDSLLFKPYNSAQYVNVPTSGDCSANKHTFFWSGYAGSPGNEEWTVFHGSCPGNTGNNGDSVKHYWYFNTQNNLFWHGVWFDSITPYGNGFILHVFSKVTVGGVDYWDEYKWFYSRY